MSNNGIEVTEVKVKKIDTVMRAKGLATVVLNNAILIRDIRIIEGENGIRLGFPAKKDANGQFIDYAHPINQETRDKIQKAILIEYNK